nr:MAG TPA: nucelotide kinase [Caudoviricetes sp.]
MWNSIFKITQSQKVFSIKKELGMIEQNNVNNSNHYKLGGLDVEVIDVIKATVKDFNSLCHGNIIKYMLRSNKKNGIEDFKKARKYIDMMVREVEVNGKQSV